MRNFIREIRETYDLIPDQHLIEVYLWEGILFSRYIFDILKIEINHFTSFTNDAISS